jgi:uncharacterized iron-regulated protein
VALARQAHGDPLAREPDAQVVAGQPPLLEVGEAPDPPPVPHAALPEGPVEPDRLRPGDERGEPEQREDGDPLRLGSGQRRHREGEQDHQQHRGDGARAALDPARGADERRRPRARAQHQHEREARLEEREGQDPAEEVVHRAGSILRRMSPRSKRAAAALPLLLVLLASCRASGERVDHRIYAGDGAEAAFDAMIADLSEADVVFLGEEHDNDVGHRLQLETVRALHAARPELVISLEQFEADVQGVLDLYLAGGIDEAEFLERSRPWPNYAEHYRPVIEYARANGLEVVAANVPRPEARRVAYEGLGVAGELEHAPWSTWVEEPEYAERFAAAMGRAHMAEEDEGLRNWFAAQCTKDDKMAESIARAVVAGRSAGGDPLVVHLCGRFHSDYRLGTASRLLRRLPTLDVRVVGMDSGGDLGRGLEGDELRLGDYVWRVPSQR